jgi:predicted RNA binding protein YcfA (HicA-like mRNA interferase family)
MAKLPAGLSGQDLKQALQRAGFVLTRQRGSHMILGGMNLAPESWCLIINL